MSIVLILAISDPGRLETRGIRYVNRAIADEIQANRQTGQVSHDDQIDWSQRYQLSVARVKTTAPRRLLA
jgi:hypothetical protein